MLYKNSNAVATATTGDDLHYNEEGFGNAVLNLLKGDTLLVRTSVRTDFGEGQPDYMTPASFCGFNLWI